MLLNQMQNCIATCYRSFHPIPSIHLLFSASLILLLCGIPNKHHAQNVIPKFGKDHRKLQINGGVRLINDFYASSGIDPRRDLFQFRLQAKLNLQAFGIRAPFTFNFSDGNKQFRLPSYTFTGISPTYKIATLHIGDRSMFFSKYTLGNITFRGLGLELRPKKFYLGAMYGRLRRAIAEDLDARQNLDTSFKRMGYGVKAGYHGQNSKISFILFGAEDDVNSIETPVLSPISPNSNTVVSIQGYQKITNKINITAEWAHSMFNKDTRAVALSDEPGFSKTLGGLFQPNASFQQGDVYNAKINFTAKKFGWNLGYEKINRGFRTLGAIYFNNDLENITAGFNKSWLKGKLNMAVNAGLERSNLDDFVAEKTNRIIGNLNLAYQASTKWNHNLQYSNFQNSTKLRALNNQELFVDSIFLAQVTQTASYTTTHLMGNNGDKGSITGILSFQNASSIIEDEISEEQLSDFWYSSLMYRAPQSDNFGWGATISYNRSSFNDVVATYITPSLLVDKSFFDKKLTTDIRVGVNYISLNDTNSALLNFGLGATYQVNKDNTLSLSSNIIQQFGSGETIKGFFESYINLTYGYRFKRK